MTTNPYASNYLLSPDATRLAIRQPDTLSGRQGAPWWCTDGSRLRDDQVNGWVALRALSLSEIVNEQLARRALGELS